MRRVFLLCGVLLLLSAAGLTLWQISVERQIAQRTETLLQQSQYLKTNPGFGPADAVCLVPDAYRFPPQDEDLRLLQCEDNVSARQENVNNLL